MKANELMVGDWVRIVDDDTDEIYETKVAGISGNLGNIYAPIPEYGETAYPFGEDCVEPIPLTSEILEKNLSYEQRNGYISWVKDVYCETCFDIEMLINSTIIEKEFEYVHQLQHALRLCGIEEDIEL